MPALTPEGLVDNDPLEQPIEEQFRAGVMSLGWDPTTAQLVIEAFPIIEVDIDELEEVDVNEVEPEEASIVRIPVGTARAFAKRTREVVGAGRPICPLCASRWIPTITSASCPTGSGDLAVDLLEGELELASRIMPASNATFLGQIGDVKVVYKPVAGERPLWDFPDGNLARRERSRRTWSRRRSAGTSPRHVAARRAAGLGMVQLWQDADPAQQAVTWFPRMPCDEGWRHVLDGLDEHDRPVSLIHEDSPALRRMAVFDIVVNNADRKGGHVLEMADGHRHGIDHGLTFHAEHKLRTVSGVGSATSSRPDELEGVERVRTALDGDLGDTSRAAHRGRDRRTGRSLRPAAPQGRFPAPRGDMPAIPWPPF